MAGSLPLGDLAPRDGHLPESVRVGARDRVLGMYVHVPFCRVRCGYCDFNTYTSDELRGAKRSDYAGLAIDEIRMSRRVLDGAGLTARPVSTVFFGGGTPTMLPASDLVAVLAAIETEHGIVEGAEVTAEANPDSVDGEYLRELRAGGFTRISFGMQSTVPHVLAALDRTHDPSRVPLVVRWAREAGLQVSLDLIYSTPGESLADWRRSVEAVLREAPDHVSAYALIVEQGTQLARRIRRGELAAPDDDLAADMYELADELFADAGYEWYEVSNWARSDSFRSRHNLGYWRGDDWWGVGPGAHSHIGGVRWWNAKHPSAYADRLGAGESPAVGRETLDVTTREVERVLLLTRLREGLAISSLTAGGQRTVDALCGDGLIDASTALRGRLALTRRGRLLTDTVVRRLLES